MSRPRRRSPRRHPRRNARSSPCRSNLATGDRVAGEAKAPTWNSSAATVTAACWTRNTSWSRRTRPIRIGIIRRGSMGKPPAPGGASSATGRSREGKRDIPTGASSRRRRCQACCAACSASHDGTSNGASGRAASIRTTSGAIAPTIERTRKMRALCAAALVVGRSRLVHHSPSHRTSPASTCRRSRRFRSISSKSDTIAVNDHRNDPLADPGNGLIRFEDWARARPLQKQMLSLYPAYQEPVLKATVSGVTKLLTEKLHMYVVEARFMAARAAGRAEPPTLCHAAVPANGSTRRSSTG